MTSPAVKDAPAPVFIPPPPPPRPRRWGRLAARSGALAIVVALLAWGGWRAYRAWSGAAVAGVPVARVRRGDVTMTVYAQGSLQGGNTEMLTAPMVAGGDLSITALSPSGSLVKPGQVVVQFDTSTQEYNLKQAEDAVAIAEQNVIEAEATTAATEEENRLALIQAKDAVSRAALQVRENPILAAIDGQKNDVALQAAKDHLSQLTADLASQRATDQATINIQKAALHKAQVDAATARRNIAAMTLRATHGGYVSIETNTNTNFYYDGMQLPPFQIGDLARPGMAVAQIPSTGDWQVQADINELDRGHLVVGQPAEVELVGLPGRAFPASVEFMGGTIGPPWNRHVVCTLKLLSNSPDLRPGMTANARITTARLRDVLWAPAQAVFQADGHSYVYLRRNGRFVRQPIRILRQSESQVVLSGLGEGDVIALANPEQTAAPAAAPPRPAGAMSAVPGGRRR